MPATTLHAVIDALRPFLDPAKVERMLREYPDRPVEVRVTDGFPLIIEIEPLAMVEDLPPITITAADGSPPFLPGAGPASGDLADLPENPFADPPVSPARRLDAATPSSLGPLKGWFFSRDSAKTFRELTREYARKTNEHLELIARRGAPRFEFPAALHRLVDESNAGRLAELLFPAKIDADRLRTGINGLGLSFHLAAAPVLWRWQLHTSPHWPPFRSVPPNEAPNTVTGRESVFLAYMQEQEAESLAYLDEVQWAFPKDPLLVMTRAMLSLSVNDEPESALRSLRLLKTLAGTDGARSYALFHEAMVLFWLDRLDEAWSVLQRIPELETAVPLYRYWRAKLGLIIGECEDAREVLLPLIQSHLEAGVLAMIDPDLESVRGELEPVVDALHSALDDETQWAMSRIEHYRQGIAITETGKNFLSRLPVHVANLREAMTGGSYQARRETQTHWREIVRIGDACTLPPSGFTLRGKTSVPRETWDIRSSLNGGALMVGASSPLLHPAASLERQTRVDTGAGWKAEAIGSAQDRRYGLVFCRNAAGQGRISHVHLQTGELVGTAVMVEGGHAAEFSLDGRWLATLSDRDPFTVTLVSTDKRIAPTTVALPALEGESTRVLASERIVWSQGSILAIVTENGWWTVDAGTTTTLASATRRLRPEGATISPDGSYLAANGVPRLHVFDCRNGTLLKTYDIYLTSCLQFTPDGRHLIVGTLRSDSHAAEILVADTGFWSTLCFSHAHSADVVDLAITPDSRMLVSAGRDGAVIGYEFPALRETARYSMREPALRVAILGEGLVCAVLCGQVSPETLVALDIQRHIQPPSLSAFQREREKVDSRAALLDEERRRETQQRAREAVVRETREKNYLCLACGAKLSLMDVMIGRRYCKEHDPGQGED